MDIVKTNLPSESQLANSAYDFSDSYQADYFDPIQEITSREIGKAFFRSSPKWADSLFELRNRIVKLFGLKTPEQIQNRQAAIDAFKCEPGDKLGLFTVFDKTENEVILGEDDVHLNFRVSLLKGKSVTKDHQKLTISTIVKFNNWFGKLYFLPVKPFHQLIVPKMLKGTLNHMELKTSTS